MAKTYKPLKLPKKDEELKKFILNNKLSLLEHVLNSVEYSVSKDLDVVEVFSFSQTDFIVTLSRENFKENIEALYNVFLKLEKYELCGRIKKLNLKL